MYYELMYQADFYKVAHKAQYGDDIEAVHSVLVARGANYNDFIGKEKFWWFGLKPYLKKLSDFERWFFDLNPVQLKETLVLYQLFLEQRLGRDQDVSHWEALHRLGYLPLRLCARAERQWLEFQTPVLTSESTHPDFPWVASFVETSLLSNVWGITTAANRAAHIRADIETALQHHTEEERQVIDFMGHDFSYRGMIGDESATLTGMGHLSVFKGSDTMPAARAMETIYGEITGFSVPASEHSVVCSGGKANELDTYRRLMELYPIGIVSSVSDTWDYYGFLKNGLPQLKDEIEARDGRFVIRPDSGDPIGIVCGGTYGEVEYESSLDLIEKVFGSTTDSQGLKLLPPCVGLIYGDSMTQARIREMLSTMVSKGWSPLNIVFGIGAFTYQFMTRDELGFAFKATAVKRNGEWESISKDPATDRRKKSLSGRFVSGELEAVN